ncbi:hypothetical protein Agub_g11670 [Astrephomene gubernaculifera]|uniref:Nucleoporin Nup54 alpha-helical domain-containing protein n=1 Tax=Astrephomene gubernaculifera TaxID=47775 RepID=A0AAD3DWY8_9CHLO|nr:hypothetical protein Agub_g11670 [Astrephomene gubernaculifera]
MAASPFQFGTTAAPPASPFGFSTANAAAAPASSAPAFGAAASAPAFGTGFSFGTGAAAAPASTPAFGAAFGAAAAKPATTFGAASSAPAFGATAAPAFGASTGGAFSFPTAAPAATSAPSLFGATTAPSLFGASSAPAFGAAASTPSLFGTTTAPATGTTTGGLFGAPAAAAAANIFAPQTQQQQQQQQTANVFGAAGQAALPGLVDPSGLTQDDAVRSLTRIAAAYNPASPDYRFQTLFFSVVERPEQRVKPPGVDENRWRAALAAIGGPNNPQKLWPVGANGFRDLNTRSRMQAEAVAQNATRLRELQDRAAAMSRRHNEFRARIGGLQRQHTELNHKLLHVVRCVDALESRLALSAGYNAQQSRQQVSELSRQLAVLEEALAPAAAAAGLQRRLEAVAAAARMRAGSGEGAAGGLASVKLDDKSQSQLFAVLRDHAEGVRQLQAILKQDELDLEVMKRLQAAGGSDMALSSAMGM